MSFSLKGCGTALITPFKYTGEGFYGNAVDFEALEWLIEFQITKGVDFLVPCGTTGESPTLTTEEKRQVIIFTIGKARGRVPIVAGTGSNCTRTAFELTEMAKKAGADACIVVAPYYNKPSLSGYFDYYRCVVDNEIPIILYDVPGRTGQQVPTKLIIDLARREIINGIKWASGDFDQLEDVRMNCSGEFSIFSGDDKNTYSAMALGACGVISVLSNILPEDISQLTKDILDDDFEKALNTHYHLLDLMRVMFIESNPIPVKTALNWSNNAPFFITQGKWRNNNIESLLGTWQ